LNTNILGALRRSSLDDHSVFSNGGTAIVIHAVAGGTSSAAPPRIACGVVHKPE
jgi:hypothetical protein